MPDYIDREAVFDWIDAASDGYAYLETETDSAKKAISSIIAADVLPKAHGKWIGDHGMVACSCCQ